MLTLRECKRDNLCVDCDDPECLGAGDIGADCPKWVCDNPKGYNCEDCDFILEYQKAMRNKEEL